MLRFASRVLISKTSNFSRALRLLHTTGSPTSLLSRLYKNPTFCKYPSLAKHSNELVIRRSVLNHTTHQKGDDKSHGHSSSVQKLIDVYVSTRNDQNAMLPMDTLYSIVKCIRKSAKEANILLNPAALNKFDCLVKDTEAFLDENPQMQLILSVLKSLGEIIVRQKTFHNKTDIDIYTSHMTPTVISSLKAQEPHTTDVGERLFLKYEGLILSRIDCLSVKELVNILWCYGQTGCGSKQFYEKLRNGILGLWTVELTNEDIGKVVCSFAKLKSAIDLTNIVSKAEEHFLLQGVVGLAKDEIVDILFAFASLQHGSTKFYQEILSEILNREARSFTPSQICKILWSFTKVSSKQLTNLSDLFNRFESEIGRRGVKHFDNRGLAVITWSLAETQHFSKHLFTLLRNEINRRNIRTFVADDLSILLKSLAKVKNRIHINKFFSKVDKELLGRGLVLFTNCHLATTLWSFAEVRNGSPAFYDMMRREFLKRGSREFTAVEFSQIIWSFARVREKLNVRDLLLQIDYNVTKLSLRQLALVLWSCAVVDAANVKLIPEINRQISKRDLSQANNPMICQIMYGLATFKQVAPSEKVIKFFEESIVANGANLLQLRQLAVLVWSFSELNQFCEITKIYEILGQEVCQRSIQEYMPSDLCRILFGFANVDHLTDTTITFHTLSKELLRRGLGQFSTAQVTMATVAMSTANQWNAELAQLFEKEIVTQRNVRSFDSTHLCLLAKSFLKMDPLDAVTLYSWLDEEVVSRDVNSFLPKDLIDILEVLLGRKGTKFDFFETVKCQLVMSNFKNYSKDDVKSVCALLKKAGVHVEEQNLQLV